MRRGRAEGLADFIDHDRNLSQPEVGETHCGRKGIDDGDHYRRREFDSEKNGRRAEVDKDRHHLRRVQQHPHHPLDAIGPRCEDSKRDADQQSDHHRDDHDGQRAHRKIPIRNHAHPEQRN